MQKFDLVKFWHHRTMDGPCQNLTRSKFDNVKTHKTIVSHENLTITAFLSEIMPMDRVRLRGRSFCHEFRADVRFDLIEKGHGRELVVLKLVKFWQGFPYNAKFCVQNFASCEFFVIRRT